MDKIYVPKQLYVSDRENPNIPQVKFAKGVHNASDFPQWAVERALKVGVAEPYESDDWDGDAQSRSSDDDDSGDGGDGGAGDGGDKKPADATKKPGGATGKAMAPLSNKAKTIGKNK